MCGVRWEDRQRGRARILKMTWRVKVGHPKTAFCLSSSVSSVRGHCRLTKWKMRSRSAGDAHSCRCSILMVLEAVRTLVGEREEVGARDCGGWTFWIVHQVQQRMEARRNGVPDSECAVDERRGVSMLAVMAVAQVLQ